MAFNRRIELSIGAPGEIGTKITDLKISFNIVKTDTESQNVSKIQIYNLSDRTTGLIAKANNKIILRVGYDDEGLNNIFFGDIKKTINKWQGVNRILEIIACDGFSNIQNKNISVSYDSGTPIQQAFNDLVNIFALPLANIGLVINGQFANGYAFVGKVRDGLTEVLNRVGKTWTIQDQQLVVITPGQSISKTGIILSKDTGLIETPQAVSDSDEDQTEEDSVPKRWRIKSLIFPRMFPGVEVELQSSVVNGRFRVEAVTFNGDNWGGDFTAVSEVIAL